LSTSLATITVVFPHLHNIRSDSPNLTSLITTLLCIKPLLPAIAKYKPFSFKFLWEMAQTKTARTLVAVADIPDSLVKFPVDLILDL